MSMYTLLGFKRLVISFYAKINNSLNQCNNQNHIRVNTFNLIRNVGGHRPIEHGSLSELANGSILGR